MKIFDTPGLTILCHGLYFEKSFEFPWKNIGVDEWLRLKLGDEATLPPISVVKTNKGATIFAPQDACLVSDLEYAVFTPESLECLYKDVVAVYAFLAEYLKEDIKIEDFKWYVLTT